MPILAFIPRAKDPALSESSQGAARHAWARWGRPGVRGEGFWALEDANLEVAPGEIGEVGKVRGEERVGGDDVVALVEEPLGQI